MSRSLSLNSSFLLALWCSPSNNYRFASFIAAQTPLITSFYDSFFARHTLSRAQRHKRALLLLLLLSTWINAFSWIYFAKTNFFIVRMFVSVEMICDSASMTAVVRVRAPFKGRLFSVSHPHSCFATTSSRSNNVSLTMPLQWRQCGTKNLVKNQMSIRDERNAFCWHYFIVIQCCDATCFVDWMHNSWTTSQTHSFSLLSLFRFSLSRAMAPSSTPSSCNTTRWWCAIPIGESMSPATTRRSRARCAGSKWRKGRTRKITFY